MKAVILYTSETGYTKKYADWISEKTNIPNQPLKSNAISFAAMNDLVIFGNPVYGSLLPDRKTILKFIRRQDRTCNVICFATGVQPWSKTTEQKLRNGLLGAGHEEIPFFYLPGGLSRETLSAARKAELFLYRTMMSRHPDAGEAATQFLTRTSQDADFTDEALLTPLLNAIMQFERSK